MAKGNLKPASWAETWNFRVSTHSLYVNKKTGIWMDGGQADLKDENEMKDSLGALREKK